MMAVWVEKGSVVDAFAGGLVAGRPSVIPRATDWVHELYRNKNLFLDAWGLPGYSATI